MENPLTFKQENWLKIKKIFFFQSLSNNLANTWEIKDYFLLKIPQIIGDVSLYPEAILRILIVKHQQLTN